MNVLVVSHGCRLSRAEQDAASAVLAACGHVLVDRAEAADLLLLDTCAVTHRADADARKAVRRAVRANPNLRVILSGCYAELDPAACRALPGVVAVAGNRAKAANLLRAIAHDGECTDPPEQGPPLVPAARLAAGLAVGAGRTGPWPAVDALPAARPHARARALLRVQDGCDYGCSYCIVPRVRGPSRSLPLGEACRRFEALVADGAPEVVLTGAHLGTYGRDLRPRRTLADLLGALVARAGRTRIRLSSLDPHELDDALLDVIRRAPDRVCPHLHLPLQSGDDGVLRRMRRVYAARAFGDAAARARRALPDVTLGTDVIAGFPGEDEAAFEATVACLEDSGVDYVHAFAFSARPGTPAAELEPTVPPEETRRRVARLRALGARRQARLRARWAGRVVDVVLDKAPRRGTLRAVSSAFVAYEVAGDGGAHAGARARGRVAPCGTKVALLAP